MVDNGPGVRNALEQSFAVQLIELEAGPVDVADITAAAGHIARTRGKAFRKAAMVNVPDDFFDKVTTTNVTMAIHAETGFSSGTSRAKTSVIAPVQLEIGINVQQAMNLSLGIVLRVALECVHPKVNLWAEVGSKIFDEIEVFLQSNDADAVADACQIQFPATRHKSFNCRL